jgi:hypothetical protein
MRRIQWSRKKVVALAAAGFMTLTGGVAFAFWSQSGAGSGSATAGSTVAVTVNQTSTNTGLYPGGSTALTGTITNPNASPVTVTAVTAVVTTFTAGGAPLPCTQADFSITGTSTAPGSVAGAATGGAWTGLTLNMTNAGTNQD